MSNQLHNIHLCKAKLFDKDEWITGFVIQYPNRNYSDGIRSIMIPSDIKKTEFKAISKDSYQVRAYMITTNTICRGTGFTDKYGTPVFESDKLVTDDGSIDTSFYVVQTNEKNGNLYLQAYSRIDGKVRNMEIYDLSIVKILKVVEEVEYMLGGKYRATE